MLPFNEHNKMGVKGFEIISINYKPLG